LIADYFLFIVFPFIFTTICYTSIGLYNDMSAYALAILTSILVANASAGFGYLISCTTKSTTMGLALAPTIFVPFMLLGGYFLNNK